VHLRRNYGIIDPLRHSRLGGRRVSERRSKTVTAVLLGVAAFACGAGPAFAQALPPQWSLLDNRCTKCHNSVDWAGGVAFDTMSPEGVPEDAKTWEAAVEKLQGRLMPPPGNPQPDQRSVDAFVSWLERRLDQAAAAHPDPGFVGLHRLNRTEYAREIQALLGLEVDVQSLLPADVASDGFDDVAAVLRVSPTFLEQYIRAARTVSRLAVGRADAKPSTVQYRADRDADQFEHIDGLPLGTRGGMLVQHYFPADGEYEFSIGDFDFFGGGYITKIDLPHSIILTIDGVRVFERSVGGPEDLKAVDQHQAEAAVAIEERFKHIRARIKAGMHRVGVSFVERSLAESDSPLQPIAELPEMERYPTIPGVEVSGPFRATGVGETESRRRVFTCRPASPTDEAPCARRILAHLAMLAFRRPVTDADLHPLMSFYELGRQAGGNFDAGIESGLTAILSSTKFLYRAEPVPPGARAGTVYALDDLSLASRLAFFLWSEGPDAELIGLAAANRLHDPRELARQVDRMLADPRSESLVTNFAFQWLGVDKLASVEPTPQLYPDFDSNLRDGYGEEMRLFLDSILRSRRSVLELLSSDRTFLNERLAREYGVPDIEGAQFRPVRLANPNRWGLLGKGAVLMATSYGNRTSPVLRGAWILETLTGTPPNSPPPGVPTLIEAAPGQKVMTVRERLEHHRINPSCNACHGILDPLGFALENFDVVGGWRVTDRDAGSPIDASGRLADGTLVAGPAELREALLERPAQFVQTLTEKLMTFALGRGLSYRDMPVVRGIVRDSAAQGYTFQSIVQGIVAAPAFQMKEVPALPAPTRQAAAGASQNRSRS
jgi:uncharacterized protein DUF1592/uncharacterized protein DUF1588/uncharacterized protein DUF1585/uncharacterized protein DUF1587/uncharacterized protein DUF1595